MSSETKVSEMPKKVKVRLTDGWTDRPSHRNYRVQSRVHAIEKSTDFPEFPSRLECLKMFSVADQPEDGLIERQTDHSGSIATKVPRARD